MKRVRTPGFGFALLLASAVSTFAADTGKTYTELPGAGKPVRAGVVITTEGGVEGTQTVYYGEGESRKGSGHKLDDTSRRGMGPVSTADKPGTVNAGGSLKDSDTPVDLKDSDVDAVVGRFTSKEDNLAGRRFGRDSADAFSKDNKYADKENPEFGRWGREGERRDRESNDRFGAGDKYDASARPEFGRWAKEGDRHDRESFAGSGDRADVKNWNELFSRDKSARYGDRDTASPLSEKVNDTVRRMHTYEEVSMQAINRTAFRRSHSDNAGDIPVAGAGSGDAGVRPMSTPKAAAGSK